MTTPDSRDEKLVGSDRVLAVLLELAEHPDGITLDDLAQRVQGSKPTVHRALASLRKAGLASQSSRGVYELGDEFLRLAYRFQDARPETAHIEPKVDPPVGAIRLTSTIGGRNSAYTTAVGKLLLSYEVSSLDELKLHLGDRSLTALTDRTLVTAEALYADIAASGQRGYGLDDQENEIGVNCVALPVFLEPGRPVSGAVSVSGLAYRRSAASLVASVDVVRGMIESHLGTGSTRG